MRALCAAMILWSGPVWSVSCDDLVFDGLSFTVCEVDPARDDLRLFHKDAEGRIIGSFSRIADQPRVGAVVFAMNAGMYHDDRSPVGHYVENGVETMRVIPNAGPGNFGLLPNGILCINDDSAQVIETRRYLDEAPVCRDATQSGPMLVIAGELHPRFLPDSTSRHIRNGVGTSADGTRAVFAISNEAVTFHEFARLFRDALGVPDALFLDGRVSRLYSRQLGRSDFGFQLGPMVAVVEP